MSNKDITIVIPTYEMHGMGAAYLSFSFDKLKTQTLSNFDIIVSDHSSNNSIKELCDKYSSSLDIKYIKNTEQVGNSSANLNNAIKYAQGDIIKILFQDDFLYSDSSLEDIKNNFLSNKEKSWLIASCGHSNDGNNFYNKIIPVFNRQNLLSGINTVSSPSVVSFLNSGDIIEFDENLVWMMDCDYYVRMEEKFGLPIVLSETNVVNRIWEKQYNNMIPLERKNQETEYIKNKFNL